MSAGPIAALAAEGVAVWLDDLSRVRLAGGSLAEMVATGGVVGVTTNPSIFEKALSDGAAYAEQIVDLAQRGVGVEEAVRALTTADVRWACDVLRPAFEASGGVDGRVSIEVDPRLARDTVTTIAEARALWWLVDRPNLLVKIPATVEGLPAVTQVLSEGISVNVTLIFGIERYRAVMDAFLAGLEGALAAGFSLAHISSVASFFVSRVDTEVDRRLAEIGGEAVALRGQAALANARLAYGVYEEVFGSARWHALAAAGARPQRPLWASTGVKDPSYDDTRYVVDLVAPGTVNTMPEATMKAVADHGVLRGDTVSGTQPWAQASVDALGAAGVDLDEVVEVLEVEGVQKFEDSWTALLTTVEKQLAAAGSTRRS
jgi:transaldolase